MTESQLTKIAIADRENDCARLAIESAVRGGETAPLNRIANAHVDRALYAAGKAGGSKASMRRARELAAHAHAMRRVHAETSRRAAARAMCGRGEILAV